MHSLVSPSAYFLPRMQKVDYVKVFVMLMLRVSVCDQFANFVAVANFLSDLGFKNNLKLCDLIPRLTTCMVIAKGINFQLIVPYNALAFMSTDVTRDFVAIHTPFIVFQ
jgi:hypothetical protein